MRNTDTLVIAELGSYRIDASYSYTIHKHAPDDLKIENIELQIYKHISTFDHTKGSRIQTWKHIRRVSLLDVPSWLYTLLTDDSVLECLDSDFTPDPDHLREDAQENRDQDYDGD